jgi:chemotaxis response regulator CheB
MMTTRILLLGMPAMLRELLVRIVAQAPDIEIVADLPDDDLRSPSALQRQADVVVVDSDRAPVEDVAALLLERCRTKVLGLSSDGRRAFLHELRPHRVPLGELSPAAFVDVIRKGAT